MGNTPSNGRFSIAMLIFQGCSHRSHGSWKPLDRCRDAGPYPDEVGAEQIYQKLQEHEEMMGGHPVNSPVELGSEIPIIIQGFWHPSQGGWEWYFWTINHVIFLDTHPFAAPGAGNHFHRDKITPVADETAETQGGFFSRVWSWEMAGMLCSMVSC